MKNKHSGMESRTQCDKKICVEILSPLIQNANGVAGGNSKREEGSQAADVPQGVSKMDKWSQTKASLRLILIVE